MKRYLAFYGEVYYPNRGMDDLVGDFDTMEEALEAITLKAKAELIEGYYKNEEHLFSSRWANIYDTELRKEVYLR